MQTLRTELNNALLEALKELAPEAVAEGRVPLDRLVFGPTKAPEHGDMGTSAPLVVTKLLGRKPLEIAQELAERLGRHPFIAAAEAAPPGFVNLRLSGEAFASVLASIRERAERFGHGDSGEGQSVLLEFVSANPTGPMHIGHCRHAATGDALARLLDAVGYRVTREFYINDAGVQVKALGTSFRYRCLEALGALTEADIQDTEEGRLFRGERVQYSGEYLAEFAADFVRDKTTEQIEAMSQDDLSWEARSRNLEMIKSDLAALGVRFDSYVSERAIHDRGAVAETLEKLKSSGKVYEKDGAQWLRTEDFGDDQDRVLVKSDGDYTYLVPDIAYHADKFQRGMDMYINLFGADHGGYPPRLRAGISALGFDEKKLRILLMRLVFLSRAGKRVKFSKRAGNFVAMSDVVEEAGSEATRWFMLARSVDSEFEFDMDLALDHTSRNPVYKVLYAHARICTMQDKGREQGALPAADPHSAVASLVVPLEKDIVLYIADFPALVERAARELAPHHLPAYLLGLAELLNRYYSLARTDASFRILQDDDKERQAARLLLLDAARQVLANGLALLGITAPERLTREEEESIDEATDA